MIGRILASALVLAAVSSASDALAQGRGEWTSCAQEGGFCRVPYPTVVRYGARGAYFEVETGRGVRCSNDSFGDPAPGVRKGCWFRAQGGRDDRRGPPPGWDRPPPPPRGDWGGPGPGRSRGYEEDYGGGGWQTCAREGGWCDFRGPASVRYGANGRWVTIRARDGINCDNDSFGDPAPGMRKACQVRR